MGSSPTGHPTKKSADALHRRIFLFGGRAQWDENKAALTHQRQSNQQPSGLLVSLRVPISRNVYQDKCCADALHRRIFLFSGVPSGTRTARHCRRQGSQQPGGLLMSARVPISRNVYRGRTLSGGGAQWDSSHFNAAAAPVPQRTGAAFSLSLHLAQDLCDLCAGVAFLFQSVGNAAVTLSLTAHQHRRIRHRYASCTAAHPAA